MSPKFRFEMFDLHAQNNKRLKLLKTLKVECQFDLIDIIISVKFYIGTCENKYETDSPL